MTRPFNFVQLVESLLAGIRFIPQTLAEAFVAYLVCLVIGFLLAVLRVWGPRWLDVVLQVVFSIVKALPAYLVFLVGALLVTLYGQSVFHALHLGIDASAIDMRYVATGVLAFLYLPAVSEAFRGGLLSVPSGQIEAGETVGLTWGQIVRRIVIPQMIPESIPALTNVLLTLVKTASLGILIGAVDVLNSAVNAASQSYDYLEGYLAAALIYWCICVVLEFAMGRLAGWTGRFKAVASV